jgi:hypothetical protein
MLFKAEANNMSLLFRSQLTTSLAFKRTKNKKNKKKKAFQHGIKCKAVTKFRNWVQAS